MSFVISTNRLFIVTQSRRLSKIIKGNFSVQVLDSAIATPYSCHLSSESLKVALNATVAENHLPDEWDAKREWFITRVLGGPDETIDAFHRRAIVHAELAMIIAMAKGDINVFPYIGVSNLSCTMCRHYIDAFNRIWGKTFVTKGSHGKAYPGWSWPSFPRRDDELLRVFLRGVRRQLLGDFEALAERERRLSDSSVGSGGAGFESVRTSDEIYNLYLATEQVRRGRGS
jgi:hypothetical protein